jgi:hypothetical protein
MDELVLKKVDVARNVACGPQGNVITYRLGERPVLMGAVSSPCDQSELPKCQA